MNTKLAEQMTLKLDDIITYISPEELLPNPYQPPGRINVTEEDAQIWYESLERSGLIHFPIVRAHPDEPGRYQVGDGWQRRSGFIHGWRVRNDDKYSRLPCVVKDLNDQQMADLALEANERRQDYNPIDRAWVYKRYLDDFKVTQEEFAAGRSISQEKVSNTMRLLELPDDIQSKIISREITESHGRQLLRLNAYPDEQKKMAETCVRDSLSTDALGRNITNQLYDTSKSLDPEKNWGDNPKFDIAGCQDCAHAETLMRERRCLDTDCWKKKQDAALAVANEKHQAELKEQGIERLYAPNEITRKYCQFYGDFLEEHPECKTCDRRAALRHSYDDGVSIVCVDPECYRKKQEQISVAARQENESLARAARERIERAVKNQDDENLTMQSVIWLLSDYFDETLLGWFDVLQEFEDGEDEHEYDIEAELQKALDGLNPHDMTKKLLAGLLQEASRGSAERILGMIEASAGAGTLEKVIPEPDGEMNNTVPMAPDTISNNGDNEQSPDSEDELELQPEVEERLATIAPIPDELDAVKPAPEAQLVHTIEAGMTSPLPCEDCPDRDNCDRSHFYWSEEDQKLVCDQKKAAEPPDIEAIKSAAKAESDEKWKRKAKEATFSKSLRCGVCGEKHHMTFTLDFAIDPEDTTKFHWRGECPKCGQVNYIKNARWDSMYGLNKEESGKEGLENE